jgi:dipeptide/tripeptide permease
MGALAVVFGIIAILTRKYSLEQAKKSWRLFDLPAMSGRLYEMSLVVAGVILIACGTGLVVAALIES